MDQKELFLQEEVEDVVEAYGKSCGESEDDYHCKKDCIIFWNALFSAVQ